MDHVVGGMTLDEKAERVTRAMQIANRKVPLFRVIEDRVAVRSRSPP
jgi:hypothetical protein